jgi:4-amino-4-deoxy-L-arabinose transferase-like glycosyltransferase
LPSSSFTFLLRRYGGIIGLGSFILVVYFFSLCPNVYVIDSGELATVSYTLGIAHPTGYPLYTLISYFFAHMPGEPIRTLNILSALLSVAAAVFLYAFARRLTKSTTAPVLVASLFAFSPIIWRTSITNEVYPLTGLLAVLLIFLLYDLRNDRIFFLLMYVIGLSFTNHMMVFSLALPLIFYIIIVHRPGLRNVCIGFLFLGLGLSLYVYILTRTIGNAKFAWGNAENIQRLFWHMTGKQYQVWMFSSSAAEVSKNLIQGLKFLIRNFLYILIIPSIFGFYVLFKKNRREFWLLLIILVTNILHTINYSIPDIEAYFTPSFIVLIVSFVYAMMTLKKHLKPLIVLALAVAIPILNYDSCTLRDNSFGADLSRAQTISLPDSSLLIMTYWDIYAPLMYFREVKKERTDLIVIDKELLRRTWYLEYLEREYPAFHARVRPNIEAYLVELEKFEYNRPYAPQVIQAKYIRLLESFVDAKMGTGVYFATPWPDRDLNEVRPQYHRIPFGLVYRIALDSTTLPFDFDHFLLKKPPVINDTRLGYNLEIVRKMLIKNVNYLTEFGLNEEAAKARKLLNSF